MESEPLLCWARGCSSVPCILGTVYSKQEEYSQIHKKISTVQPLFNPLSLSRASPPSLKFHYASSQTRLKSCRALPPCRLIPLCLTRHPQISHCAQSLGHTLPNPNQYPCLFIWTEPLYLPPDPISVGGARVQDWPAPSLYSP